ncbi:restriction endonuclease subunit S [Burkholderia multivorans]|uniref:restriction endonuclease subunit S n=1 Tax=Burkholderia multivorans TaxID=87883 RepID=UPI000A435996|nr:restriction endonuclease subunit S [Burkholderia multivorans]
MQYEYRPFGELLSCPSKNGLTRPKKVRGSGLPMVNMGELFANPRIFDIDMDLVPVSDKEMEFLLKPGDLLFARQSLVRDGAGQCSIFLGNKQPTVFESHLIRCRLNPDEAVPEFYFYYFRSPDGRRVMDAIVEQGAGAAGIRGSDLIRLSVPVPSLAYQREVADLFRLIDNRIDVLRQTNATLESIAQALFKSWFIDFDPVRAKAEGREPEGMEAETAALFPDSFEDSALGEIPNGWAAKKVGEVFSLIMGQSPPGDTYNAVGDGVPFYQGRTDFGFRFPTERIYCTAPTRFASAGATLVSVRAPVGDVNVSIDRCAIGRGLAAVEFTSAPAFALYTMKALRNRFSEFEAHGTVFGSINKKQFESLPCILPSTEVLLTFSGFAGVIDEKIRVNERYLRTLTELRDTVLPRLISGKLRLPEAEAQLNEALA